MNNQNKTIVCFQIKRGGTFNNPGELTYSSYTSPQDVVSYNQSDLFVRENDEGEEAYFDSNDDELCLLSAVESGEFRMEFDGDYDTWYCCNLENCNEAELKAIINVNADNVERAKELMVENFYVPEGWYDEQEENEE